MTAPAGPPAAEVVFVDRANRIIGSAFAVGLAAILLTPGAGLLWSDEDGAPADRVVVVVALVISLSAWRNRVVIDGRTMRVGFFFVTRTIDLADEADWRVVAEPGGGRPREALVGRRSSAPPVVLGRLGVRARPGTPQAERLHALCRRLQGAGPR